MKIVRLNVGQIREPTGAIWSEAGYVWAVWPSPVDHDQCFQTAGFDEFADTDDLWDEDFSKVVERTVETLSTLGSGTVTGGQYLLGETKLESLQQALLAGTKDDNLQPPVVSFGDPALATLRTSDGHSVLWIWLQVGDLDRHLAFIADGLPVTARDLIWRYLLPVERPPAYKDPWWKFW
jgi:hypothetical protein